MFFRKIQRMFSNDIGIDLGTANTLVFVRGKGIVVNEPSIVAFNTKTDRIVAVGDEAQEMLGRNPEHLKVIRPLVDGVISDFEITEEMLAYLINKTEKVSKKFFRPRVVVGVPSGITNVEHRAVYDATTSAGAREVYIIEEPMAAAIGMGLPIHDPTGSMVVDIGGGTADIAVISLDGIVQSKNIKVAGDKLNQDIINYFKDEFKVLIGERTADEVKKKIASVFGGERLEANIHGRDMITGLPRKLEVNDIDIRTAIKDSMRILVEGVKEVIERTPPELVADITKTGIYLSGGGALINGFDTLLEKELGIAVHIAEEPLTAVARGAGIVLDDINKFKPVLYTNHDELPPK